MRKQEFDMSMTQRQALELWRRALTDYVRSDETDMTARQQSVLMTVALTPGPHTVRGLAAELNIAKPAVTRALDVLEKYNYIRRVRDQRDMRSVLVQRTAEATRWMNGFSDRILAASGAVSPSLRAVEDARSVA
jgi:DNA-binding MarR family transcriptional regulator